MKSRTTQLTQYLWLLSLALGVSLSWLDPATATDVVYVDAMTRLDIGDVDYVDDRLFSINAGAGQDVHYPVVDQLKAANIRSVRHMIRLNKQLKPRQARRRRGFVDPAWWNRINFAKTYTELHRDYTALDAYGRSTYLFLDHAYGFQPQSQDPKFVYALPVRRAWEGAVEFNAEWLRRMNQVTGRPMFDAVEFWNEPDNPWWNRVRTNEREERAYARRYIDFFLAGQPIFRRLVPTMQVGGPSLCGYRWSHWERWIRPFIERAGDKTDFVTQHWYEPNEGYPVSGLRDARLDSYLGLVYFLSKNKWGHGLPVEFTEFNSLDLRLKNQSLPAMRYGNAVVWARLYASVLRNPEKVRGVSHHMPMLNRNPNWRFRLFDIVAKDGRTRYEPWPTYWVFYSLRYLRGPRVLTKTNDPIITAATVNDGYLNLWLFNNSNQRRSLAVQGLPIRPDNTRSNVQEGKLAAERLVYDPSQRLGGRFEAFQPTQYGSGLQLEMTPFSMTQMRLPLPTAFQLKARLQQQTHAANPVGVELARRTQPIKFSLNIPPEAVQGKSDVVGELLIATALESKQSNQGLRLLLQTAQEKRSLPLVMPRRTQITRIPVPQKYLKPGRQRFTIVPQGFKDIKNAQLLWVALETKQLQTK